jgi:hypothetical protein
MQQVFKDGQDASFCLLATHGCVVCVCFKMTTFQKNMFCVCGLCFGFVYAISN